MSTTAKVVAAVCGSIVLLGAIGVVAGDSDSDGAVPNVTDQVIKPSAPVTPEAPAPVVPAPGYHDDRPAFKDSVSVLRDVSPIFDDWTYDELRELAEITCEGIDDGVDFFDIVFLMNDTLDIPLEDGGAAVAFSVLGTCPEFTGWLERAVQ